MSGRDTGKLSACTLALLGPPEGAPVTGDWAVRRSFATEEPSPATRGVGLGLVLTSGKSCIPDLERKGVRVMTG
jgi:hypothetical protein